MSSTSSTGSRRRRYTRSAEAAPRTLTPQKRQFLRLIADLRICSLPQAARLAGTSAKMARYHCRGLFDAGLVAVIPVARIALAGPEEADDTLLLYGSAPNVFAVTAEGLRMLRRLGWDGTAAPAPRYGPRNSYFLGHTLAIQDVRVYFELLARRYEGHKVELWRTGKAAEVPLGTHRLQVARPDARFIYRFGSLGLQGLLEVDMGTERGGTRWQAKIDAYTQVFAGETLKQATGYHSARVLVITPDARRRDHLARFLKEHAPASVSGQFWLADRDLLEEIDLTAACWRRPGIDALRPLFSAEYLHSRGHL